jgi:hypothetical protein
MGDRRVEQPVLLDAELGEVVPAVIAYEEESAGFECLNTVSSIHTWSREAPDSRSIGCESPDPTLSGAAPRARR